MQVPTRNETHMNEMQIPPRNDTRRRNADSNQEWYAKRLATTRKRIYKPSTVTSEEPAASPRPPLLLHLAARGWAPAVKRSQREHIVAQIGTCMNAKNVIKTITSEAVRAIQQSHPTVPNFTVFLACPSLFHDFRMISIHIMELYIFPTFSMAFEASPNVLE